MQYNKKLTLKLSAISNQCYDVPIEIFIKFFEAL